MKATTKKEKATTKKEKVFTFEEYKKTLYPDESSINFLKETDSYTFGVSLARKALDKHKNLIT